LRQTMNYQRTADGQFECPECHVIKRLQSTMHYHMKTHLEETRHTCPHCAKTFLQKRTMDLHIAAKHTPVRTFTCPLCPYASAGKGNLLVHCFRMHFKDEVIALVTDPKDLTSCTACHGTFKTSTAFYYHAKRCVERTDRMKAIKALL